MPTVKHKCYGKVVPVFKQAPCHEDLWENRGIAPGIPILSEWSVSCPRYPLNRRLGKTQSGHNGGEAENPLPSRESNREQNSKMHLRLGHVSIFSSWWSVSLNST